MEKTKKQKIASSVFCVVLVLLLAIILLNNLGIVDFKKEANLIINSDYYWQSEPFGEIDAVWCLESQTEKSEGDSKVYYYLRSADGSREYTHGDFVSVEKIVNCDYKDIDHIYDLYTHDGLHYTALFVPLDCEYVTINNERFETKTGKINTNEGEIEFKYFTATYKSAANGESIVPDVFILYSESGQSYKCIENLSD